MTTADKVEARKAQERSRQISMIRQRLDSIHAMIDKNRVNEAEVALSPLRRMDFDKLGLPFFAQEVKMLDKTIVDARAIQNTTGRSAVASRQMLAETDERLKLPETYGKSVVIDANLPPVVLPAGPMEKILNGKVSISLDNAGIAELVGALREVCKLNVIADDALQAEKTLTIAVEDVPLKEVLSYISRNMGVAFNLGENILWITESAKPTGPLLETRIIRLRQGTIPTVPSGGPGAPGAETGGVGSAENKIDNELDEALTAFMNDSPDGAAFKIFPDRNILVIKDTRENIRLAEQLVSEFDKPPYQVVIEARFITVSQDDLRDIGTEIEQKNFVDYTNLENDHDHIEAVKAIKALTSFGILTENSEKGVGLMNFSGVIANRTLDIMISALDKKSSTVTLSVPKVTVMNNRQARIRKGDKLYYFEEYDVETLDRGDRGSEKVLVPSGTPTELPLGLTFDVKVNVGNDGRTVLLGLKPEIVKFKGWETYLTSGDDDDDDDSSSSSEAALTEIKLPKTYEQAVVTTVGVSSGQTVVLGGMLENKKNRTVKQIPFFGDIPIIGYLFKHEEVTHVPINLLIFVTATVINDRGEFVEVLPEGQPSAAK